MDIKVLVFNCGSSSLKYKLIKMPEQIEIAGGEAQRIGPPTAKPSCIIHHVKGKKETIERPMHDHEAAFKEVMQILTAKAEFEPDVVGHRLVHGGTIFKNHVIMKKEMFEKLLETRELAPLHNPPAIALVQACQKLYPDLPQALVFDTAYHSTIPDYAQVYALPEEIREGMGIRKYGFHGTSHQYVAGEAAKYLDIPIEKFNAVSCHLGSGGASLCAIVNGKSVDNTMGYSPLQGLIMSTRCGDLDSAVIMQLLLQNNGDWQTVEDMLNKQSGVLGITGSTSDIRDVVAAISQKQKSETMNRALQTYIWRIKKYLGAYMSVVAATAGKNANAVIFTDTIGETMPLIREGICSGMEAFGMIIDAERNEKALKLPVDVSAENSDVQILAVQTNEELAIAEFSYNLLIKEREKRGNAA